MYTIDFDKDTREAFLALACTAAFAIFLITPAIFASNAFAFSLESMGGYLHDWVPEISQAERILDSLSFSARPATALGNVLSAVEELDRFLYDSEAGIARVERVLN